MKASPKWFGRRTISVSCTLLDSSSRVICRNASEAISKFGNCWKAISKNLSKTFCPSAPSIIVLNICSFYRKPLLLVTYYTRYIKLWNVLYLQNGKRAMPYSILILHKMSLRSLLDIVNMPLCTIVHFGKRFCSQPRQMIRPRISWLVVRVLIQSNDFVWEGCIHFAPLHSSHMSDSSSCPHL